MSIRTKFALGLISILVVNLGAGLYGLHLYRQVSDREMQIREQSSTVVATALTTQVHFKKQVQEWKNILLRGGDEELYRKYLRQFEEQEQATEQAIGELLKLLRKDSEGTAVVREFLNAHIRLGREYRSALAFFQPDDPNREVAADQRVRGIDREPTDLMDRVVEAALAHKQASLAAIDASAREAESTILLLMAGVMSAAVLALIWLVDRDIGRPIATATAIARRVSAGDFSTPIVSSGSDEKAQMLAALKTMQENLARSRESLKQSEAQTRLLLESTSEGIYGMDADGRCTFCNPAAARMLGYASPSELEGLQMHQTMHHSFPDGSPYPLEQCQAYRTCRDGEPTHMDDELFWRADGSGFPVEYHSNAIRRENQLMGAVVNFSDISERKRADTEIKAAHDALQEERSHLAERVRERTAELDRANAELARSSQAKDEFLAAMSHELRTPLTSILGLSETLEDGMLGKLSTSQAKAAHTIHENGVHLLDLIKDVLDMSRVASGRMNLHWDQVPVNQLWDASLNLIRPAAEAKALSVSTNIDPAVQLLRGDSRRLKQMLVNLLGNAVKFTPDGGTIGLDVNGDPRTGKARIGVWDTGVGIAKDQLERLFQPFVQVDSRLSRRYDGTGLGLALAFGMAQLHDGTIEVESEPGKGSCFSLVLPWDPDSQSATDVPPEETPDEAVPPRSAEREVPRVLLVDDNRDNLEMISSYLSLKGCWVTTAANGLEAVSAAGEQLPDIILMDVQMPEMDGLEATRRLREQPALAITPIIALTALAMPGDKERCLEAGMDDYLVKPLGLKELHRAVLSWIKRTATA